MRLELLLISTLLACGGPAPSPSVPAAQPATPSALVWSPSGGQLVVDDRWLMAADTSRVEPVPPGERPVFAADDSVAWLTPGAVRIRGQRVALPALLHPPVADRELQGLWLDLERLYLHEWHPIKRAGACRIYDRRTAGLRAPRACLAIEHPTRLQPGPGDLVAVFERRAAGPALTLARYTPERGTAVLRRFDLRPDGAVAVAFSADGGVVRLTSACDLAQPRPCTDPSRLPGHWLFEFDLLDDRLQRTAPVPDGAVPSAGARLAWPVPGGVCVADRPGATPRCRSLVPTIGGTGYSGRHVGDDHP